MLIEQFRMEGRQVIGDQLMGAEANFSLIAEEPGGIAADIAQKKPAQRTCHYSRSKRIAAVHGNDCANPAECGAHGIIAGACNRERGGQRTCSPVCAAPTSARSRRISLAWFWTSIRSCSSARRMSSEDPFGTFIFTPPESPRRPRICWHVGHLALATMREWLNVQSTASPEIVPNVTNCLERRGSALEGAGGEPGFQAALEEDVDHKVGIIVISSRRKERCSRLVYPCLDRQERQNPWESTYECFSSGIRTSGKETDSIAQGS